MALRSVPVPLQSGSWKRSQRKYSLDMLGREQKHCCWTKLHLERVYPCIAECSEKESLNRLTILRAATHCFYTGGGSDQPCSKRVSLKIVDIQASQPVRRAGSCLNIANAGVHSCITVHQVFQREFHNLGNGSTDSTSAEVTKEGSLSLDCIHASIQFLCLAKEVASRPLLTILIVRQSKLW